MLTDWFSFEFRTQLNWMGWKRPTFGMVQLLCNILPGWISRYTVRSTYFLTFYSLLKLNEYIDIVSIVFFPSQYQYKILGLKLDDQACSDLYRCRRFMGLLVTYWKQREERRKRIRKSAFIFLFSLDTSITFVFLVCFCLFMDKISSRFTSQ